MDAQGKNSIEKIIGWGLLAWELIFKYAYAVFKLKFENGWIEFPKANYEGVQIDYYLLTINPTAVRLKFTGFQGDIWFNDIHISNVVVPYQIIKANAFSGLKFSFWVSWVTLVNEIITADMISQFLTGKIFEGSITINGRLLIAGRSVPLKMQLQLSELKNED